MALRLFLIALAAISISSLSAAAHAAGNPCEPEILRAADRYGIPVGILYAVGTIARGDVAPGIVGGILAAILTFLVFREVGNRQRRRIEERERRRARRDG